MIRMRVQEKEDPVRMSVNEGIGQMVIEGAATYGSLPDKPKLNGVTLNGDVSLNDIGVEPIPLSEIAKMFKGW